MKKGHWYNESVQRTQAWLDRELYLGRGTHTGRPYYLEPRDYFSAHMHIIGAPDFGKSFFIEHVLRSHTELGTSASLIDPHGDQARSYHAWVLRNPRLRREKRIIHFAPGTPSNTVGFNPFECGLADPAEVSSLVLESVTKVFGKETSDETPRLERILRIMFYIFALHRMPLTEAPQFLLTGNRAWRESLLANVPDDHLRANWREIEDLPRTNKMERFESSWNRIQRFISIPAVADLFNGDKPSLNFTEILDRGDILIADLSGLHSTEAQSLVGTMMVNSLYHAAKRRPESKRRPWVLAIDEFPQFVTTDIARSLDTLRKFGIRLILAHQHLSQLPHDLLGSVLTSAQIKVVFGGLPRVDAEAMTPELFTGYARGDRTKHITSQTKFRPILTKRTVTGTTKSEAEGESKEEKWNEDWSDQTAETTVETEGGSRSTRENGDKTDETVTNLFSTATGATISRGNRSGRSGGRTTNRQTMRGESEQEVYVNEPEEFLEETGRQFWSLDEEWEMLIAHVKNLKHRQALIKVFNHPVLDITTPDIELLPARTGRTSILVKRERERRLAQKQARALPPASNGGRPPMKPPKSGPAAAADNLPEDFRE